MVFSFFLGMLFSPKLVTVLQPITRKNGKALGSSSPVLSCNIPKIELKFAPFGKIEDTTPKK